MMKPIQFGMAGVLISTTLLLSGCGGGGVDYNASVVVSTPTPAFEIGALVSGLPVTGFDALPGDVQTITMSVGQTFELDSNSPVTWNVFVNGVEVPSVNNTIIAGNVTINETLTTNEQFAGYATSQGILSSPVQITLIATSLVDSTQTAQINFVITN